MAKPKSKSVRSFPTEEAERAFWATNDATAFVDWGTAGRRTLPKLKPTLRTISLRLPESMLGQLKVIANKRDIPYQSLLKQFLAERLKAEMGAHTAKAAS